MNRIIRIHFSINLPLEQPLHLPGNLSATKIYLVYRLRQAGYYLVKIENNNKHIQIKGVAHKKRELANIPLCNISASSNQIIKSFVSTPQNTQ
jgi:hypothetical protein